MSLLTKKLLILSQIGSPKAPTEKAVGEYLQEFLMDKEVIPLPKWFRWILVNMIIVPRRKKTSTKKYHKIWTEKGAPLVWETNQFIEQLKKELGPEWDLMILWRYGDQSPLQKLPKDLDENYAEILVAPLYPQYAEATTGSALRSILPVIEQQVRREKIKILKPFYQHEEFIQVWSQKIAQNLNFGEHVLFSYHGLPEDQVLEKPGCLINQHCCERAEVSQCYLAQCRQTTQRIAERLQLSSYSMSFQSRLGVKKWLRPSSEEEILNLICQGKKKVVVACPSFVTDGLETLEEIDIELRQHFLAAGGESFRLIAGLNHDPEWISGFSEVLRRANSWLGCDFKSL